ncbi:hypothetical protein EGW08_015106 [Elysia chlorotica]|uniref:Thioredoxin domain-containing protein n=1 Tax=Elysia chlorotica TaxID=188477 RepID=A0A433T6A5_ELYCH|nr:hypothetical protein EGW08_015106 [Elysia chlorotica]
MSSEKESFIVLGIHNPISAAKYSLPVPESYFAIGMISKGKPVVLTPSLPQYMFHPSGPVHDAPLGTLGPLIQMLQKDEIVVTLYYAPWCTKSREARFEYLKAALYFEGKVRFAAINCWWGEGECRKRYKFLMFPVLMVYHTKLDGYRFSDTFRAEHIVKFVERLMHPVSVVHSKQDVQELVAKHDTVVFGHFNLSCESHIGGYRQFYFASMRIIEKDPFQPIKLAVVTHSDIANQLGMKDYESIVLFRITNTSMEVVKRLSLEGVKSQALAEEINKGPALLLFHVEDPLFDTELLLHLVKDLALLYNHCKLHPLVEMSRQTLVELAHSAIHRYQWLSRSCQALRAGQRAETSQRQIVACCMSTVVPGTNASDRVCSVCCQNLGENSCGQIPQVLSWVWDYTNSTSSSRNHTTSTNSSSRRGPPPLDCRNMQLNYSEAGRLSICCRHNSTHVEGASKQHAYHGLFDHGAQREQGHENFAWRKSSNRRMTDRYVRDHLEEIPRRLCDRLSLERMQKVAPSSPSSLRLDPSLGVSARAGNAFVSLGCSSARPLNFYSIDQHKHWMFSDFLGVKSVPAVVLVDKEREQHFVMKENITFLNTLSFIVDFKLGLLKRHQNSHGFAPSGCGVGNTVCVQELNTSSFHEVVMEENKDVVLLVYAHWCGFCQTFSHTFLSLAQYFSPSNITFASIEVKLVKLKPEDVVLLVYAHWCGFCQTFSHTFLSLAQYFSPSNITFARINGALNDLPWQFTFSSYPVVIIFPAKRKADSVVYSPQLERSLPSLVSFVLRNIEESTRLLHIADVCSHDCKLRNLRESLALQQELSRKHGRLQARLQDIALSQGAPCSDSDSSASFASAGGTSSTLNSIDGEKDSSSVQNKPSKPDLEYQDIYLSLVNWH